MVQNLYTRKFKAGACIFSQGEDGDLAYIVESGVVKISATEKNASVTLGMLNPGQLFGEMALIDDAPRTATATAVEDTVLTIINREQLIERLNNAEPTLRMLIHVIIERYRTGIKRAHAGNSDTFFDTSYGDVSNASGDMQSMIVGKLKQENELRRALDNNELLVFYQPLLNVQTGLWAGFEALIRWRHPDKGYISPMELITLAEETTLIIDIGLYVLRLACEDMATLQAERDKVLPGAAPLFVGVNVSSKQIQEDDFIERIAEIVAQAGLPPTSLKLEITESMMADYQLVVRWVKRCKARGFKVAIDDFGTGYSSMEHLLELDADTLKIDQIFIKRMSQSEKAKKLVIGMVRLAKALGFTTVAEGLESKEDVDALREMSVEYGQGYHIGKPQMISDVLEQIKQGA